MRGLPEFGGELPAAVLAEEIETPGEGQIRALVTCAGNPVLSTPNGARLDRALAALDFMVAIDLYLNETTRHAHLILPPTFALEREHYDLVFHALAVRNTAKYSPPLFPAPRGAPRLADPARARHAARDGARRAAAAHAGSGTASSRRSARTASSRCSCASARTAGLVPFARGLSLGRLRESRTASTSARSSRACRAALHEDAPHRARARRLVDDLPRLRARARRRRVNGGLALIGRRDLRCNNSWMHNSERLVKGRERCTLLMHPHDATRAGCATASGCASPRASGAVEAPLEVSDEMLPGVVSLPHGWGHARAGTRLRSRRRARRERQRPDRRALVDPLCGTAALNGVPVEVSRAGAGRAREAREAARTRGHCAGQGCDSGGDAFEKTIRVGLTKSASCARSFPVSPSKISTLRSARATAKARSGERKRPRNPGTGS